MRDGRPSCPDCLHPMECLFAAQLWRCEGCDRYESWQRLVQRLSDELAVQRAYALAAPAAIEAPR